MTTTVVTSVRSLSRIDRARAWLENRDVAEEVLIVGASLGAANELARTLAKAKGGAFGWHRLTLAQLAASIASPILTERALASITQIGTEATVTRLLHRLRIERQLGRFEPIAHTPGFPRAIAAVVTELRLAGLSSEALAASAPDLSRLLAAYELEIAELSLADWPKILSLAADAAVTHRLSGTPLLLLDVPIASEAELAFLRALALRAPESLATVPAADRLTLARVRHDLDWPIEDLDLRTVSVPDHGLHRLQRNLFEEVAGLATGNPTTSVEIFSAPGEGRECVEIARHALVLARQRIPFDRMAVLLRSPEKYRTNVEEAFNRAGIPVYFARGTRRPDPAGRAFYALLKCAAEGLSARRFAEYLSLGQVPDADAAGGPPPAAPRPEQWVPPDSVAITEEETTEEPQRRQAEMVGQNVGEEEETPVRQGQLRAPRRWEQLLIESAVIGSHDRWRRRLDGLGKERRARLAELSDDETHAAALARTLDDLAAFTAYTIPLIDLLDSWPHSANWGDWLGHCGDLATRALKHPDRVLAVLAELAPVAPVGPVSLSEVVDVLGPLLLERAVPPPQHRYGKIFVGPVEAARGLSFDAVFVPGLAERMFPRKIVEEPILLDSLREQISGGLTTNQSRLDSERVALAVAVGAAEARIYFSYPRLELQDQPRPRVPSFYLLEAWRATEGRLPDFTEVARRAETAAAARLGWPGPPEPADAIDSAEYDLAILDRLAAAERPDAGAARYLITANSHLARGLRSRYQRWGKSWTGSDGLVNRSEMTCAAMARHTFTARSYSPTTLQSYAGCPYRFFLHAVHRLAPRTEPAPIDELDPLQRGALIHDIQLELFSRLRREALLPIRSGNLDRVQQELDAVITDVAAQYHDDFAPAIERIWLDGIGAIGADLREWLRQASLDTSGFVPRHFELSFGLELRHSERPADPRSVPGAVTLDCGIQLRGAIDLVERHRSGLMRVTDHKTGKANAKPDQIIAGGTALQPVFYALAAEKLLAGEAEISCGRLYFCTSRGGYATLEVALDTPARMAAAQVADALGGAIAEAFLPAYPVQGECARCDYRVVCGPHEERRVARKQRDPVEPLIALREAP